MESSRPLLDLVLVPMSFFLCIGYHLYLWLSLRSSSRKAFSTGRTAWMEKVYREKEKGGMLGVQSFRNTLMAAILSATISVTITTSVAAMSNNAAKAGHLLGSNSIFGIQTGRVLPLKYATVTLLALSSFACSSMAVGCIIESNFLLNSCEHYDGHAGPLMERGCLLAAAGNRILYMALVFLFWLLGPVPLAAASAAAVWMLHSLDFVAEKRMRPAMLMSGG